MNVNPKRHRENPKSVAKTLSVWLTRLIEITRPIENHFHPWGFIGNLWLFVINLINESLPRIALSIARVWCASSSDSSMPQIPI
jgi:hypothetical protein